MDKKELETEETEEVKEEETTETTKEEEKSEKSLVDMLASKLDSLIDSKLKIQSEKKEIAGSNMKSMKLFADSTKAVDELTKSEVTKEFVKALISNDHVKLQVLSEGTGALGGFLVPEEWNNELIEFQTDLQVIRPRATVHQIMTDTFHVPQLASMPKAQWRSELSVKSTSTAEFAEITLTPYSLAFIVPLSQELVEDASIGGGAVATITRLMAKALAIAEERAFAVGSGSGQPTGLLNSTYTNVYKTISAGNALNAGHIISAFYGLNSGYRNSASWLMNSRTIGNVRGLTSTTGELIFRDALTEGSFPTLMGRPVLEQNDMASSQILFGDLSLYHIADRGGIEVLASREATIAGNGSFYSAFQRNALFIRAEKRTDGENADTRGFVLISNTGVA